MATRKTSFRTKKQPENPLALRYNQDVANWPNLVRELVRNNSPYDVPKLVRERFGVVLPEEIVQKVHARKFNARHLTRYIFWKIHPKRRLPSYF